ncbi:MAG: hypothetical protein ACI9VR_000357 [Cognaticolwellia sp.]|jgi:hypothetical protein
MRVDFVNQAALEAGLPLPVDALGHQAVASRLLTWSAELPPGSVIAVQGEWGRGKTDLLARLAAVTVSDPGPAGAALWLNPWQYGTPDLLSPLIRALNARGRGKLSPALKSASERLMKAGLNFGLKGAAALVPGGQLFDLAAPLVGELAGVAMADDLDADPVACMAQDFCDLTQAILGDYSGVGSRLLVCVDDLDRCAPNRQMALLQGLRFLLAAGAPVTVLVALDPFLAREGVRRAYGSQGVDADRYLDKIFDLRVSLPGLRAQAVQTFWAARLAAPVLTPAGERPLGERLPAAITQVSVGQIAPVQSLRNPRVLSRLAAKLALLQSTGDVPETPTPAHAETLLLWMAMGERWPVHRALVQSGEHFAQRLSAVARQVGRDQSQVYDGDPEVQALAPDAALAKVLMTLLEGDMAWLEQAAGTLAALGI